MEGCISGNRPVVTTCAYCGVGCGIKATIDDLPAHKIHIVGDDSHPANFGRLCSKGSALGETVSLEGRLLDPEIEGRQVSWDQALENVVQRLKATLETYGPESIALYGSGQLLTEDYYVANKLMKGFLGSANIDTNSRLCMASTVAAHKRAFGEDVVPGCYEDLEQAELIVLCGSNTAWCHPVLFQRIRAARKAKIVVIDPRDTATCDIADLHLPILPGTDTTLYAGLLAWLVDQNLLDPLWIEQHTEGLEEALDNARRMAPDITAVSAKCGLATTDIEQLYHWFGSTDKTVTAWSQGTNQGFDGTDRVNAIINVHLATGRIGKPGSGPLSLTGQPNAMGGREVGGLANQLAAHMDFQNTDDINRVRNFWKAAKMATAPGLTAVDMFSAISRGDIKFVWIMGTNPAASMPDAQKVSEALAQCPNVIVSDCMAQTDTTRLANVLLPAAPWSEKDGTVTNSERRISRQRALLPLSGQARPDWWIVSEVGRRIGYLEAFPYKQPVDIFREHVALSALDNNREQQHRHFNLGWMKNLASAGYDNLTPVQWPKDTARLFADGGFSTASGKARFVIPESTTSTTRSSDYPTLLNTGRIRDQWHTMTRTALSPRLQLHIDEPFVQVNHQDAETLRLADNEMAIIESRQGRITAKVKVDSSLSAGQAFMPMHWTRQLTRGGTMGTLVHPRTDPISRQPDSKATAVKLTPAKIDGYGVLLSRNPISLPETDYCAKVRTRHGWRYELAWRGNPNLRSLLPSGETVTLSNGKAITRTAIVEHGQLLGLLITSPTPLQVDRHWLQNQFTCEDIDWRILAGFSASGKDSSPIICACHGVSKGRICKSLKEDGINNVAGLGRALKAGTNCGSCIPELTKLLQDSH